MVSRFRGLDRVYRLPGPCLGLRVGFHGVLERSPRPWVACRRCSALANARRDHREGQDLALCPHNLLTSMHSASIVGSLLSSTVSAKQGPEGLSGLPPHRQGAAAAPSAAQWTSTAVLAAPVAFATRCNSDSWKKGHINARPQAKLTYRCSAITQSEDKEGAAAAKLFWSGLRSA